jgi:nitrite reductase/ring-hydroxylating ferredoxin subunit
MLSNMMIEVGELVREVGASAARAIEDELDWEHLPFTHASTFSSVSLNRADEDGWDANVVLRDDTPLRMVVTVDADRFGYINATFGPDGTENGRAVCRIEPLGKDECRMSLRFLVPDQPGLDRQAAGAFYSALFSQLIDEDEPKMIYRTQALRAGPKAHRPRRQVVLVDGTICQVPLVCPHQGLPFNCEPDSDGIMQCPWHGYRFDVRTGECISGQIRGWQLTSKAQG